MAETDVPAGWTADEASWRRTYRFASFAEALAFMVEIGTYCEKVDHHPDWSNSYDRVAVTLTTHDAGGVTDKDRQLARRMDAVFGRSSRA